MNGITRQTVIKIANEEGIKVAEKRITLDQISEYEECFVTGTAAEVTPVKSIDNVQFNPGNLCKLFINKYTDLTLS